MRAVSPCWMWWNKGHSECYSTRYTMGPVTSVLELMLIEVVRSLRTPCTSPLSAASCNSVLSTYDSMQPLTVLLSWVYRWDWSHCFTGFRLGRSRDGSSSSLALMGCCSLHCWWILNEICNTMCWHKYRKIRDKNSCV